MRKLLTEEEKKKRHREYMAKWRIANIEKTREQKRKSHIKCRDRELIQMSEYQKNHKAEHNVRNGDYNKRKRLEVIAHYGNRCACCGETNVKFLTIDHVNNDGNEHRKTVPGSALARWLVRNNYPDGFQVLCWNCNLGKRCNNGVCPHRDAE